MNQIKHILSACLIVLMIFMALFLYTSFPESGIIGKNETVINYNQTVQDPSLSKGRSLFQQNCGSCHHMMKDLVGPALDGVTTRGPWTEKENLLKWIKDPAAFISTTPYTEELYKKYNQMTMPSFGHLTDEDINEIIRFISAPVPSLSPAPVVNEG